MMDVASQGRVCRLVPVLGKRLSVAGSAKRGYSRLHRGLQSGEPVTMRNAQYRMRD